MEEEKDIIYELPESGEWRAEGGERAQAAAIDDNSDHSDHSDNADNADNSDNADNADTRLRQMIDEVGAETLLEIIRDNRNAAIRQIISEVEASQDRVLQSGVSAARKCNSIFDLAALA